MNRIYHKIIVLGIGAITLLASCVQESDPLKNGYGYLKLQFSEDKSEVVVGGTKSTDPVFAVKVTNSEGVVVRTCTDHRELEAEPLKVKAGTYTISATSGEASEAAFAKPFYQGASTVEVAAGNVASSSVVCSLAQVKVSIAVDPSVTEQFQEYIVTVSNTNTNGTLIFSSEDQTINDAGYFNCTGQLDYNIYLINNKGNVSDNEVKGSIANVKPREHYILKLKVSDGEEGGASNPSISGDDSTNDNEYNIIINLNKKSKPKYTANGFNLSNKSMIALASTLSWRIGVEAKAGINTLTLSHNSLTLSNMGIPYAFDIVNMSAADRNTVNALGLTWSDLTKGTQNTTLDFSNLITTLPLGEYAFGISTLDEQNQKMDTTFAFTIMPSVETNITNVEPWAKQAFFYGVFNTLEQPSGMGFEYKKASESSWIKVMSGLEVTGNAYSVKVTGLEPSTGYVVRTVSDKEPSGEISFTTEAAIQIPNMGFDSWYESNKSWYANVSSSDFWWDSGNAGANSQSWITGTNNPTSPSDNVAVAGDGKKAAMLKSMDIFSVLAAGNIYTGRFGKTIGTTGAQLNFGQPYTCRPLTLKGYYSYIPVAINKTKAPYTSLNGQSDICQIYVLLTDWDAPFAVNTSAGTFIDINNDPRIIAYGSLEDNTNTGGYKTFEIPIVYRSKRIPKYCVIVCSASKYGDYFTGGVGSTLYIDEFEFTF